MAHFLLTTHTKKNHTSNMRWDCSSKIPTDVRCKFCIMSFGQIWHVVSQPDDTLKLKPETIQKMNDTNTTQHDCSGFLHHKYPIYGANCSLVLCVKLIVDAGWYILRYKCSKMEPINKNWRKLQKKMRKKWMENVGPSWKQKHRYMILWEIMLSHQIFQIIM